VARGFEVVGQGPLLPKQITQHPPISVLGGKVSARTALQKVEDVHSNNTRARTGFFWRRHYGSPINISGHRV